MVKVIWHKAALLRNIDGSIIFARLCQCAPHPLHTNWHPLHTVLPSADTLWVYRLLGMTEHRGFLNFLHYSFCFFGSVRQTKLANHQLLGAYKVTVSYHVRPIFTLKIAPSRLGTCTPSTTWLLGPTWVNILNGITICVATFAGLTAVTDRQRDEQTTLLCQQQ